MVEGSCRASALSSALGSVSDKVKGLTQGADDYLVKPFEMAELLARLDAVCRRATIKPAASLQAGDLSLDVYHWLFLLWEVA